MPPEAVFICHRFPNLAVMGQKKTVFIVGLILLCLNVSFGQSAIDSLKRLVQIANERANRAELQEELGFTWEGIGYPDSAIFCYQSAYKSYSELDDSTSMARTLESLGVNSWFLGDYTKALSFYSQALQIDSALADNSRMSGDWNNLGLIHFELGNFVQSMQRYQQALQGFRRDSTNHAPEIGRCQLNLGITFMMLGLYEPATQHLTMAVRVLKQTGDYEGENASYLTMADVLIAMGLLGKAEGYLRQAIIISANYKDTVGLALAFNNMGEVFLQADKPDSANTYFLRSLNLKKRAKLDRKLASTLRNLGEQLVSQGKNEKARSFFEQALLKQEFYGDLEGQARTLLHLGLTETSNKTAEDRLLKGLEIAEKIQAQKLRVQLLLAIKELFEQHGDIANALEYANRYSTLKDSLDSDGIRLKVAALEALYQKAEQERAISVLEQENAAQNLVNERQRAKSNQQLWIYFISLIIIVSAILIYLQYLKYRNRRKQEIATLNAEFEERNRIARDLHDNLGAHLFALQYQLGNKDYTEKPLKNLQEDVQSVLKKVSAIVGQLYIREDQETPFSARLKSQILRWSDAFNLKLQYENEVEPALNLLSQVSQHQLQMVISEIMKNAKHHGESNSMRIYFFEHSSWINCALQDDGKGFQINGTKTGIGLESIKRRVEFLAGEVKIDSKPGLGTTYSIQIPIPNG